MSELLFDTGPEGFSYAPDFLGEAEERALVGWISSLALRPFEFHGFTGNRRVVSFGWRYDYAGHRLDAAEPLPALLGPLQVRAAAFAGRPADFFVQALITEYAPGAGIGWHRDKRDFGEVAGISLLSPCPLRFRRRHGERWKRHTQSLAPRSIYLLSGPARTLWEHSIAPVAQLRYSITLRSLTSQRLSAPA